MEAPESKSVLIYEKRPVYAESIANTINNLGVACSLAQSREVLTDLLAKGNYAFVFSSAALYGEVREILDEYKSGAVTILLTEYGETLRPDVQTLAMPVHPLVAANILNGKAVDAGYIHAKDSGTRFTAPDARILIVDDITTNLDVAEGLLAPYQVQIHRASGGPEAVSLIQKNQYDLVLMDHMMPGMDGIEAAGIIRLLEGEYFKALPIAALTANAIAGMREMYLEKGFNDYLSKPIEIFRLDEIMGKWIPVEKKKRGGRGKPDNGEEGASPLSGIQNLLSETGVDVARGIMMTGGRKRGTARCLPSSIKTWLNGFRSSPPRRGRFPLKYRGTGI
ncbi:MAG: response regulator [Spirochaetaceae bacterium]|nr:response regulator [Spirochaetaceae bacterium]